MSNEYLVQINYKSGTSMQLWCTEFKVKHTNGVLSSVEYTTVGKGVRPIYLGNIESIESVFQIEVHEVVDIYTIQR
jgi:hypothetical protein